MVWFRLELGGVVIPHLIGYWSSSGGLEEIRTEVPRTRIVFGGEGYGSALCSWFSWFVVLCVGSSVYFGSCGFTCIGNLVSSLYL